MSKNICLSEVNCRTVLRRISNDVGFVLITVKDHPGPRILAAGVKILDCGLPLLQAICLKSWGTWALK